LLFELLDAAFERSAGAVLLNLTWCLPVESLIDAP